MNTSPPGERSRRKETQSRTAIVSYLSGLALAAAHGAAATSDGVVRQQFERIVQDVRHADGKVYDAKDSAGHTMDTAKIIADPAGGYLAVYHTMIDGVFETSLATSTDLLHWTFRCRLGDHASQPYLSACSNGGFVAAWEQDPSNHIRVLYYPDRSALLQAQAARSFDVQRTLAPTAEGTPNIYSVTFTSSPPDIGHSVIDIGAHYYQNQIADRQQRGTLTDFSHWTAKPQEQIDRALFAWGVKGNIGDRDSLAFAGHRFVLVEGMRVQDDWSTWLVYCYDASTGNADRLTIHTDGGSTAFANPSCTRLRAPNGRRAVVVTLFIPSQGAAPGENGELIYFRNYQP